MANDDQQLKIVQERQKTIRMFMFLAVFAVLAVVGIMYVFRDGESGGKRKVDLDLKKGTISLSVDKPIVEQVKQPESTYDAPTGTVKWTTGQVDEAAIEEIASASSAPIRPDRFTGENFINRDAGFLLTVPNPGRWEVNYDPSGMHNAVVPVNTIFTDDGSHLNVNVETLPAQMGIEEYVTSALQTLAASGLITAMPEVSYDYPSKTAFLFFNNQMTGGQSYMKTIIRGGRAYIATANYNAYGSDPARVEDLTTMVGTFTLIGS